MTEGIRWQSTRCDEECQFAVLMMKIRELEAELNFKRTRIEDLEDFGREEMARAEKAERELDEARRTVSYTADDIAIAILPFEKKLAKAEARVAEHDSWCEYRKRLELSFALGELSGAIKKS